MRRRGRRHIAAVAAVAALAIAAGAAGCGSGPGDDRAVSIVSAPASPAPTTRPAPAPVYLVPMTQLSEARIAPTDIRVFKDLELEAMTWTSWTAAGAVGDGRATVNLCTPSCADATYFTGPAEVALSRPERACGTVVYTSMAVTWTDRPPPGQPRSSTFSIFGPVC